jgi:hypothetical protein
LVEKNSLGLSNMRLAGSASCPDSEPMEVSTSHQTEKRHQFDWCFG